MFELEINMGDCVNRSFSPILVGYKVQQDAAVFPKPGCIHNVLLELFFSQLDFAHV